jgi:hypothetical protein
MIFPKPRRVEVYSATTLFVGHDVTVEIVIDAEDDTKVEYIDARLTGKQGWRIGSGKHAITARAEFPALVARLRDEGVLPGGKSSYRASFRLPPGMPPSHAVSPAWASLELYVRVAIPWWPDGKYKFTLPVRVPPPATVERKPYAIRSTGAVDAPRLELSLASTNLIAGETVVGSLAVYQLDDRKPRDVELTLVPSFKLHRGRRFYERRGSTLGISVTIPAGGAGASVPFRFKLPADMTPSFKTHTHELAWWLVAKSGSFFGAKVEVDVPLTVFDASAAARTERLIAAPRLTDERITGAFAEFARVHGWREATDEMTNEQLAYERDLGDATLRVGYEYRGEEGAFLIATLAYPSIGLGLSISPSSRVRELFTKDIEVSIADWDRAHHVLARSAVQSLSFLRVMVPPAISAAEWLGPLRTWTDDEIRFERAVAGVEIRDLVRASDYLTRIAEKLAEAPIQSPPELEVDLAQYTQLAQRLQGRLTVGDLMIEGTLDQRPVMIALEFADERPTRIYARVGDPEAALDDQPLTDAELAEPCFAGADVQLAGGIASASLPLDGRMDVARVKELVMQLRALLARRDPNHGPYR